MPGVTDMWKVALQDGYCITLFRDEIIMFHKEFQNLLDGMKGYSKRVKDIQDAATQAVTTRGPVHKFESSGVLGLNGASVDLYSYSSEEGMKIRIASLTKTTKTPQPTTTTTTTITIVIIIIKIIIIIGNVKK